ncbi:MAG: cell division protein FtsA [Bacilli bacterium]|nr:cell division protein FtsA [Bacilli bacterium]MBQ6687572.1 cell division protein FtsA [Bacilli bacterium]
MRRIIASLDIGSNSIKLVIGEIVKSRLNILAALDTPSRGIKKGFIVNSESAIEALSEIFNKAEDMLGLKIKKVIASVPSNFAECFLSEGSSTITNENKVVGPNDIVRAMQASVYNKIQDNMELVTIIPTIFRINDTDVVKNPKNMIADKLTVKSVIVSVPKKNVMPIVKCLERIGVEVVDIALSSLGDYALAKTKDSSKEVGALINIGDSTTTVSIFNRGVLTNTEVIDLGGQNIDNDIAFIYKIPRTEAKYLKENLSLAHKRLAVPSEYVIVTDKNGESVKVNQYEISEVVMSRLEEMLNLAKKQINLLTKKEISYIIFTGGVTESVDFGLLLEEIFGNNVILSQVSELGVRDNKYSTSVGLIKYYNGRLKLRNKEFSIFSIEEQEELSGLTRKVNISENSILGKLFGYFFDN